jgi:hypothetical protein
MRVDRLLIRIYWNPVIGAKGVVVRRHSEVQSDARRGVFHNV